MIVAKPQLYVVVDTRTNEPQSEPADFDTAHADMMRLGETWPPGEFGSIDLGITEYPITLTKHDAWAFRPDMSAEH